MARRIFWRQTDNQLVVIRTKGTRSCQIYIYAYLNEMRYRPLKNKTNLHLAKLGCVQGGLGIYSGGCVYILMDKAYIVQFELLG